MLPTEGYMVGAGPDRQRRGYSELQLDIDGELMDGLIGNKIN